MNNFYTYIFIDLNNLVPFYVGKGCAKRINKHFCDAKNNPKSQLHYKINELTKDKILIKQIYCETEEEAFIREIHLISLYGRKNISTGPLLNKTDGGEGMSGHVYSQDQRLKMSKRQLGKIASFDTRKKISETHKNKPKSLEHRKKISLANSGRNIDELWKQKISDARKGKKHSEETKRKISEAVRKAKNKFIGEI